MASFLCIIKRGEFYINWLQNSAILALFIRVSTANLNHIYSQLLRMAVWNFNLDQLVYKFYFLAKSCLFNAYNK
jgi:hypothetical protein